MTMAPRTVLLNHARLSDSRTWGGRGHRESVKLLFIATTQHSQRLVQQQVA
jgi:hypothetical protein